MIDTQERTRILVGQDGLDYLNSRHVLVAGLGGVGGAVIEALARAHIGTLTLVDHDDVGASNLNRQLITTHTNIGIKKAEAAAARLREINPEIRLNLEAHFLHPENAGALLDNVRPDYVLDCIDSVTCKGSLVAACQERGIPIASSLGAGGRLDVSKAEITTLKKTHTCGLARALRHRLRSLGASMDYPVVFSSEPAINAQPHQPIDGHPDARPRAVNGTISYMPNLFGFMLAGFAIQQLLQKAE
jgi:tRNA A37 threonylcarbamoyladenosine dehydratase